MLMLNFQDLFLSGIEQLLEVLQLLVFVPLLPHYTDTSLFDTS